MGSLLNCQCSEVQVSWSWGETNNRRSHRTYMSSEKTSARVRKSIPDSAGDRRTGSVGERPELSRGKTGGDRHGGSIAERDQFSIEDEIAGATSNDPGLGGE